MLKERLGELNVCWIDAADTSAGNSVVNSRISILTSAAVSIDEIVGGLGVESGRAVVDVDVDVICH